MDIKTLTASVWRENIELQRQGLTTLTWGNVSGVDREAGVVVIKPSGVPYEFLKPDGMAIVSLADGRTLSGSVKPSSDAPAHLALYRNFPEIGGVVHTHSAYATGFAQARRDIPCLGSAHASSFNGNVPLTRPLTDSEACDAYELNIGLLIVETVRGFSGSPLDLPGALVSQHGPFTWGATPRKAVENAVALEALAKMAFISLQLNPELESIPKHLINEHFLREHGRKIY